MQVHWADEKPTLCFPHAVVLQLRTCWNWGELSVFWISSALCGKLSPLGRKGRSLCWTSAFVRIGAIISGVQTLAKSTKREKTRSRWCRLNSREREQQKKSPASLPTHPHHWLLSGFSSPADPWAAAAGTFMVARMLWRSLSWMGWWGAGLPTDAGASGVWAEAANKKKNKVVFL